MKLWSQRNGAALKEQLPLSDRMRSREAFLRGETRALGPAITNGSYGLLTAFPHLHRAYWRAYLICKAPYEAYSSYIPPLLKHVSFIHFYYVLQSYHIISFKPFSLPHTDWTPIFLNHSLFYFHKFFVLFCFLIQVSCQEPPWLSAYATADMLFSGGSIPPHALVLTLFPTPLPWCFLGCEGVAIDVPFRASWESNGPLFLAR